MIRLRSTAMAWIALVAAAATAEAQVEARRYQVAVQGGWYQFADGSALEGGAALGGDATYFFTPTLGLGIWTDYSVTESDGSKFPPASLSFVDSTTFTIVNQPVEVWQYGIHGKLRWGAAGRVAPFVTAGVGGYTIFLDGQQNDGAVNFNGFTARVGAGVDLAVSDRAGFQLAVVDAFFPDWKPERLMPTRERNRNTRFPELNPDPGDLSDSVHNFRITVALTLIPAGGL